MKHLICCPILILMTVPSVAFDSCRTWQEAVSEYSEKVDRIVPGEVSDIQKMIRDAVMRKQAGDFETVGSIGKKLSSMTGALRELDPPVDLARHHDLLLVYTESVLNAVEQVASSGIDYENMPADQILTLLPVKITHENLLNYYQELLDLLVRHECDRGDIEALETRIIPELKETILSYGSDPAADGISLMTN